MLSGLQQSWGPTEVKKTIETFNKRIEEYMASGGLLCDFHLGAIGAITAASKASRLTATEAAGESVNIMDDIMKCNGCAERTTYIRGLAR